MKGFLKEIFFNRTTVSLVQTATMSRILTLMRLITASPADAVLPRLAIQPVLSPGFEATIIAEYPHEYRKSQIPDVRTVLVHRCECLEAASAFFIGHFINRSIRNRWLSATTETTSRVLRNTLPSLWRFSIRCCKFEPGIGFPRAPLYRRLRASTTA